eukprot:scaffold52516_cov18-Tisochrysis_lutea.AAC.3
MPPLSFLQSSPLGPLSVGQPQGIVLGRPGQLGLPGGAGCLGNNGCPLASHLGQGAHSVHDLHVEPQGSSMHSSAVSVPARKRPHLHCPGMVQPSKQMRTAHGDLQVESPQAPHAHQVRGNPGGLNGVYFWTLPRQKLKSNLQMQLHYVARFMAGQRKPVFPNSGQVASVVDEG